MAKNSDYKNVREKAKEIEKEKEMIENEFAMREENVFSTNDVSAAGSSSYQNFEEPSNYFTVDEWSDDDFDTDVFEDHDLLCATIPLTNAVEEQTIIPTDCAINLTFNPLKTLSVEDVIEFENETYNRQDINPYIDFNVESITTASPHQETPVTSYLQQELQNIDITDDNSLTSLVDENIELSFFNIDGTVEPLPTLSVKDVIEFENETYNIQDINPSINFNVESITTASPHQETPVTSYLQQELQNIEINESDDSTQKIHMSLWCDGIG